MPDRRVVRYHIGGVRSNRHGRRQGGLLPPCGRLIGKGDTAQESAAAGPQMAHMRSGVPGTFVKPDTRNVAVDSCLEFQPELNCTGVRVCGHSRRGGVVPDAAWTGLCISLRLGTDYQPGSRNQSRDEKLPESLWHLV